MDSAEKETRVRQAHSISVHLLVMHIERIDDEISGELHYTESFFVENEAAVGALSRKVVLKVPRAILSNVC